MKPKIPVILLILTFAIPACTPAATAVQITATQAQTQQVTVKAAPALTPTASPDAEVDLSALKLPAGIELSFWHPWSGDLADLMEELVVEFNQSNQWGITVNMQVHADELVLLQDMNDASSAGALPDVVAAPSAYLKNWYRQGWPLQDLAAYTASPYYGMESSQLNAYLPVFWKNDLVDAVRLGLPAYRDGHFLFYNQTWASELGFDAYPQTSADFQTQACTAAAANMADATSENNGTGGWLYNTQPLSLLSWLRAFDGDDLLGADGEIDFKDNGNLTALAYLYSLYDQDCSWTGRQSEPFEYFAGRYALFYSGDTRDIFTQELVNENDNSSDQWELVPYPSDDYRPVMYVDGDSYAVIRKNDDQALAAWLFLRFLASTENQARLIQVTGSLPLSTQTIAALTDFRQAHPVWDNALQYLALAQPIPDAPGWLDTEAVLSDMAWQLKYTTAKESLPDILSEAQSIVQGN
jgi:multiple sugar transport system substrate-binding protein